MKALTQFILLILLIITGVVNAQTQFWSDTFEDVGAPSSGSRTPSVTNSFGGPPATRYFFRTDIAGIALQNGPYTSVQGSKFWAGEDIDAAPAGVNGGQSAHQNVTWTGINISGKTGLSFRGLFACDNVPAAGWQGQSTTPADYMIVEYRINGGAWTNAVRFFSDVATSGKLAQETTGDSLGESPQLSLAFTEFTANIVGTGTTLDLRFKCHSNGATSQELAVDNFRLFYLTALPVTISSFSLSCDSDEEIISWTSESERNLSHYEVERSLDLNHFETIAIVPAQGESSEQLTYSYPTAASPELYYYRLKSVDLDGTIYQQDPISSLPCESNVTKELLKGYAFDGNKLNLILTETHLTAELFTLSGQSLSNTLTSEDEKSIALPLPNLETGVYILVVRNSSGDYFQTYKLFY